MTTPAEARAAFLWLVTDPFQVYRTIARTPLGQRAELTRAAAAHFGVSTRTIERRVARFWPAATEPQEPGTLHALSCAGPEACSCEAVRIG